MTPIHDEKVAGTDGPAAQTAEKPAHKAGEQIKREGLRIVDQEKSSAAREVHKIGSAMRSAAASLRQNDSAMADWAGNTADMIDKASDYISNRRTGEIFQAADDYARHHPGLVIGGMFLAGIAAARFFRASTPPSQ